MLYKTTKLYCYQIKYENIAVASITLTITILTLRGKGKNGISSKTYINIQRCHCFRRYLIGSSPRLER